VTRFERRGRRAGRPVTDLSYARPATAGGPGPGAPQA
jgi:hypothetical protein